MPLPKSLMNPLMNPLLNLLNNLGSSADFEDKKNVIILITSLIYSGPDGFPTWL
jgi:hypothetical protein